MTALAVKSTHCLMVETGWQPGSSSMAGSALTCVMVHGAHVEMTALTIHRPGSHMVKSGRQPGGRGMTQGALPLKMGCRAVGHMTIQALVRRTGVIAFAMAGLAGNLAVPAIQREEEMLCSQASWWKKDHAR